LGWFANSLIGKSVLPHSGDTYGFKSNFAGATKADVVAIILNNIDHGGAALPNCCMMMWFLARHH